MPGFSVNVHVRPSADDLRQRRREIGLDLRAAFGRRLAVVREQRAQQATAVERPRDAVVLLLRVERLLYVGLHSELQRPTDRRLAGRGGTAVLRRLVRPASARARREGECEEERDEPDAYRRSPEHAVPFRPEDTSTTAGAAACSQKFIRRGRSTSGSVFCPNLPASCCQSTTRRNCDGLMPVWLPEGRDEVRQRVEPGSMADLRDAERGLAEQVRRVVDPEPDQVAVGRDAVALLEDAREVEGGQGRRASDGVHVEVLRQVGFEVGADLLGMLTNVPALVVAVAEDPEQALTPPLAQSLRWGGFAGSCGFLPHRGSMPTAQAPCQAEPAAPKMDRCRREPAKTRDRAPIPMKTGCRDTARGHRRATARVPAPAARGDGGRDPDVRSGARCAILDGRGARSRRAEREVRAAGAAAADRSRTRARSARRGGFGTARPRQLQERIARLDETLARISAMLPLLRGGDDRDQEP